MIRTNGDHGLKHDVRRRAAIRDARRQADELALREELLDAESFLDGSGAPPPYAFPGYRIVEVVRTGGQGAVYRAVQLRTEREVAIKVIRRTRFASRRERTRFEREVRILERLDHPGIVHIHEHGVQPGYLYLVMDFVRGRRLDEHIAAGRHTLWELLDLFTRICDVVHAAHRAGVVHRDLKYGNVLIDGDDQAHVLDFGLAKFNALDQAASRMTLTGQFVGSLPWAAPEQVQGLPGKTDTRTDVYTLGILLYHMLIGRFPYQVAGEASEVLANILEAPPTPPTAYRNDLDDELAAIALKCLSKDPNARYENAGALVADIRRYQVGKPVAAKCDNDWYVMRKTLSRTRMPAAVAAALLIDSIVGMDLRRVSRPSRERQAASTQVILIAAGLLGTLIGAAVLAAALAAGSFDDFIMRAFDTMLAGAFLFSTLGALGVLLLTPPDKLGLDVSKRRTHLIAFGGIGGASALIYWLTFGQVGSTLIPTMWAVGPGGLMVRGIEHLMRELPEKRVARLARIVFRTLIMAGAGVLAVLVLRVLALRNSDLEGLLLASTLLTVLLGLATTVSGMTLLVRTRRALLDAQN